MLPGFGDTLALPGETPESYPRTRRDGVCELIFKRFMFEQYAFVDYDMMCCDFRYYKVSALSQERRGLRGAYSQVSLLLSVLTAQQVL